MLREPYKRLMKKNTNIIPLGQYCYVLDCSLVKKDGSIGIKLCPYWDFDDEKNDQECGYCHYLESGDWSGTMLLWDQCKERGINYHKKDKNLK